MINQQRNTERQIKDAYIYVASGNYNVVSVNGKRCDDTVLQNADTEPTKTLHIFCRFCFLYIIRQ